MIGSLCCLFFSFFGPPDWLHHNLGVKSSFRSPLEGILKIRTTKSQTLVALTLLLSPSSSAVSSCSSVPTAMEDASSTLPIPSSRLFPAFLIPVGSFSFIKEMFLNLLAMVSRTSTDFHYNEKNR